MEGILAVTFIFGGGSLFLLAVSPVGRAIADRIRGVGNGGSRELLEKVQESHMALTEEVYALRQDLIEVQERLDFTERLLAQHREAGQLPSSAQDAPE